MTQLVQFKSNLPAASDLKSMAASLRGAVSTAVASNDIILKMGKDGIWTFGKDAIEVQPGSRWAINPFSFVHGFIAWGDGEALGEKMAPMGQPLPETGPTPVGARSWDLQLGVSLQCVSGEDKGTNVIFRTTSHGGKSALKDLGNAIADRFEAAAGGSIVPLVELDTESYQHKQYGKIYKPVITIVDWVDLDGNKPGVDAPAPVATLPASAAPDAVAAAAEPPRRRRRAAATE